ncbi:MAG TPA: sigma 54-interacting transcriptional regulator [Steroidobacteraceae bacterium]|nr:sigma 54-interacting transcriptional regulator [Steroidobacteraceae bacterium]
MAVMPPGEQLELLAASFARARTEDFFPVLAAHLGAILDARETLITEAAPGRRARTLAVWRREGAAASNYEYDVAGLPCARVYDGRAVLLAVDAELFPGAPAGSRGYFGMPLTAKDGAVLGHLCAWLDDAAGPDAVQQAACEVLADRAAAELRLVHVKRERAVLRAQKRQLRAELDSLCDLQSMVGQSAAWQRVLDDIRHVAATHVAVLISGEPGTGKDLVARTIHAQGARATRTFTRIDCAALDIEAVLGTLPQIAGFTNGGTLYLDEVGALAPEMQARLEQLLGATAGERREPNAPDVRLLASTNRDLARAVREGEFREDLFRRLSTFSIDIPPLRSRVDDIPPLVQQCVQKQGRRLGRRIERVDPDTLSGLMRYPWPGNVRELLGLVERALVAQHAPVLKIPVDFIVGSPAERAALIAAAVSADTASTTRTTLAGTIDFDDTLNTGLHAVQREHILRVLNATRWVIEGNSGAALRLGMKPATLRHRMKKLGISRAQNPHAGGHSPA